MITSKDFEVLKKDLISNDTVSKSITLDKIDITESGIRDGWIRIEGNVASVDKSFFRKLAKMVNVNSQLASSFIKNDDEQLYALLIKAIKQYKTIKSDGTLQQYTLVADANSRTIIDILKGGSGGRLSMSSICDITDKILNDHSNIELESAGMFRGNTNFNFINNNSIAFPDAGPDEEFKFGFSICTTPSTTKLSLYNQRLVCANGMRVNLGKGDVANQVNVNESFYLRSLRAGNLTTFFNSIKTLGANSFIPIGFKDALLRTRGTKASLNELEKVVATIMTSFPDEESVKDYKKLVKSYFPALPMAHQRIVKAGFDPYKMNENEKSNIKTHMSIWDVVNNLTFLGSNKSEFDIINKDELKVHGGRLFDKALTTGLDLQYSNYAQI